ncbi:MAG: dTDP-glucose 4,6-dehydratase [Thaumarchaeota archaeon]|nr:MAG: dTDP-glucose 4,6-dehydratase [Nitrososphaerota archaeon]
MKLLVTGGFGFIGSNFILKNLAEHQKWEITNLDAMLYGSNENNLTSIENNQNYKFVEGNISDYGLMKKLISEHDVIINFAAESFVDRSISDAKPFLDSNVNGVFTILEILKNTKKKFIHISTDEVYGSLTNESAKEDFRFNPSSPYSATKASAELLINAYYKTYDCNCIITRCTNNYGPRQFPEKFIPKSIILANLNKSIPIYGTGKNIRDWLFVDDHCDAITYVLEKGEIGKSYNISANNEIDNLTIVNEILSIMDKSTDLIEFVEDRPGHDFRYSMDSSLIRKEIGWMPKVEFKKGLEKTVQWYLENKEWWEKLSSIILDNTPWKKES